MKNSSSAAYLRGGLVDHGMTEIADEVRSVAKHHIKMPQFERALIRQRVWAGFGNRRAEGKRLGAQGALASLPKNLSSA